MYCIMANKIRWVLSKKGYEKNIKQSWIEYIAAIFLNFLLASGIGYTFGIDKQMIVFSVFYSVLRVSTGGGIVKLNVKNAITLWGTGIICIVGLQSIMYDRYFKILLLLLIAVSVCTVLFLLPSKIKKMKIKEDKAETIKKGSRWTVWIESCILIIGVLLFNQGVVVSAVVGMFVQSISILTIIEKNVEVVDTALYSVN